MRELNKFEVSGVSGGLVDGELINNIIGVGAAAGSVVGGGLAFQHFMHDNYALAGVAAGAGVVGGAFVGMVAGMVVGLPTVYITNLFGLTTFSPEFHYAKIQVHKV